jgi:hypothetical protein
MGNPQLKYNHEKVFMTTDQATGILVIRETVFVRTSQNRLIIYSKGIGYYRRLDSRIFFPSCPADFLAPLHTHEPFTSETYFLIEGRVACHRLADNLPYKQADLMTDCTRQTYISNHLHRLPHLPFIALSSVFLTITVEYNSKPVLTSDCICPLSLCPIIEMESTSIPSNVS